MLDKARVMLMAEQEAAVIDGTATARGPVVGTINIGGIPSGWAVAACTVRKRTCHSRPCAG
jgi:hypothetical protein